MANDQIETLITEAERVIAQLGENKTKDLSKLKAELDRMIAASKEPGFSPNDEAVQVQKRALVIAAMETALHTLREEGVEAVTSASPSTEQAETPTAQTETTTPTQSAFVPERTTPLPASASPEEPTNAWQKLLLRAGTLFSSLRTYVTNLWNKWFGKKEDAPVPEVKTETPTETATTTPETTTPPTAETPASTMPETTPPSAPDTTTPVTAAEVQPTVESVSLMDGAPHEIAGHQFIWTGEADNLFTLAGKKFGVSNVTGLLLKSTLQSIRQKGDLIVIDTSVGRMELDQMQIASLVQQTIDGTPTTETKLFGGTYKVLPVTVTYTSIAANGTRTPGSRTLELLPK